jgi:hypothetical protein
MRDCLDADALLDEEAREQRAHATLRPRAVRHIDGVDAGVAQLRHVGEHLRCVDTARRYDLD